MLPGVGDINAKNLIAYCGSAEAVFAEKKSALEKIPGIGKGTVAKITNATPLKRAEQELAFVEKFSKTLNNVIIEQLSERLSDAHYHLERNANAKIVFMNLSIAFSNSFKR